MRDSRRQLCARRCLTAAPHRINKHDFPFGSKDLLEGTPFDHRPSILVSESEHFQLDKRPGFWGKSLLLQIRTSPAPAGMWPAPQGGFRMSELLALIGPHWVVRGEC